MATSYLMQLLSMTIQRGNVAAVLGSLGHACNNDWHLFTFLHSQINCLALLYCICNNTLLQRKKFIITRVAAHYHTQQHSEFDEDSGTSSAWRNSRHKTTNAENSCGKTRHLDLRDFVVVQKRPATEPITLRRAQHRFWFPQRSLIGKCCPSLGWWRSSERVGETPSLPSKRTSTSVCHT